MLRAVLPLFRAFLNRFGEGAASGRRTRSRAKLEVTPLEDRCVLAQTLLWIGANAATPEWSRQANWANLLGNNAVPANGDTLVFDPSQTFGTKEGQNSVATNDIAGLSLTGLTLAPGYGATVTLNNSLSTMTLTMRNGEITSAAGINLTITGGMGAVTSEFGGTGGPRPKMTGAGSTIISPGVVDFEIDGFIELEQRTLTNKGTILWKAFDNEPINTNNATINNEGTFDLQTNSKIRYTGLAGGPLGSFNTTGNQGKVTKTDGTNGFAEIHIPFNVSSTLAGGDSSVSVTSGNLSLWAGGASSSKFAVANNLLVSFAADSTATYTWNNGTDLTGAGFYSVTTNATATIPFNATVSVEKLELDWGTIAGDGELKISKELNWLAGTMSHGDEDPGNTTILLNATATIGGAAYAGGPLILDGRALNNQGTVNLKGSTNTLATFQVNDGAVINNTKNFYIQDDSSVKQLGGAAKSTFKNTGWLEKTGGDGWSEVGVDYEETGTGNFKRSKGKVRFTGSKTALLDGVFDTNGGEVEVTGLFEQSGGIVPVSGAEAILSIASMATVSGGTVNVSLGGTFTASSGFAHSGGSISVMGAGTTLNVSGGYAQSGGTITVGGTGGTVSVYGSFVVSAGTFILDNGLVTAFNGLTINSGGTLSVSNSGKVTGDLTNSGTLTLAASALLEVTEDYTQSGTLNVSLASSSTYSRLAVSGVATLGGTLYVSLDPPYMPPPMNAFEVLTYGSHVGTFATHTLPPLSFGVWQNPLLGYDNDDFTLRTLYF